MANVSRSPAVQSVRPAAACHPWAHRSATVRADPACPSRRGRSVPARGARAQWHAPFLAHYAEEGLEGACRALGLGFGDAVAARARNAAFRQACDRIGIERLAAAEIKVVDRLLERLAGQEDKGQDKAVLALWQALKDDRRRSTAKPAPDKAASAPQPRADLKPLERAAEVARLIEIVEARLAEAEAGERGSD